MFDHDNPNKNKDPRLPQSRIITQFPWLENSLFIVSDIFIRSVSPTHQRGVTAVYLQATVVIKNQPVI